MANFIFPVVAFAFFTLTAGWIWWLMSRQPERWSTIVAKENQFWIKQGLASQRFADRIKHWETSATLRRLMLLTMVLSVVGFCWTSGYLIRAVYLEHRKVRLPFNPALYPHPPAPVKKPLPKPPSTNSVPSHR